MKTLAGCVAMTLAITGLGMTSRAAPLSTASPARTSASLTQSLNRHIDVGLKSASVPPSPPAVDAEFVRRIYLDLYGVVPTVDQVRSFLDERAADKRTQLIDRMLADRRFARHLADLWDDYLVPANAESHLGRERLAPWLEEQFYTKSWDRIAHEILTATGKREKDVKIIYILKSRETLTPPELTDLVSQYFLGIRMNCAQCHDHPFTSWKQTDYWGLASFFTQVQYTDRRMQKSGIVRDDSAVDIGKLENAEKLRTPKFLRGEKLDTDSGVPYRVALADWITAADNPYFAKAMVNRIWWQLFGRGLVEPVDDMHEANPVSHPELLAELSREFVASGFDLRHLYRAICNSEAYQRSSIPLAANRDDTQWYSHMAVKVLTPEQLYDSLAIVAPPTANRKGGKAAGDPRTEFVLFFRSDGDANPRAYDRGIPQTLRMMNAPERFAPQSEAAAVRRVIEPGTSGAQALDKLYLHVLARTPTDDERKILDEFLAKHSGSREEAYAEILWSLINSSEFSLNH
jgi:hypothetical protein